MKYLAAVLVSAFIAQPVNALSCVRPDVIRLYQNAVESDESYYFVKGRIKPDGLVNPPEASGSKDKTSAETQVRFVGEALTRNGFANAFDRKITLRLNCLLAWCGSAPLGREIYAALNINGQALELNIGPCGFNAVDYSPENEARLLDCHQNGNCAAEF